MQDEAAGDAQQGRDAEIDVESLERTGDDGPSLARLVGFDKEKRDPEGKRFSWFLSQAFQLWELLLLKVVLGHVKRKLMIRESRGRHGLGEIWNWWGWMFWSKKEGSAPRDWLESPDAGELSGSRTELCSAG